MLVKVQLTKQLPLLALVDSFADVKDVVSAFKTLTDISFELLVKRDWARVKSTRGYGKEDPLANLAALWKHAGPRSVFEFNYRAFLENVAAIIMARLALMNKASDLVIFVSELRDILKDYFATIPSNPTLQKLKPLAYLLLAMTRKYDMIDHLSSDYAAHVSNCDVVLDLRRLGLAEGAKYLEDKEKNKEECKSAMFDQPSEKERKADPETSSRLQQLRFVVKEGQLTMGVPVIISEFDKAARSELTDLGPWKPDDICQVGQ
ncbi:hypothetical protein BJ085DRAFT_38589 [Dimargaris cristalligena]|uniref:Uncharacterized protein n=1 Tax=Dimargaris cristalligena TaxID=215637 RepID=A0A4P9ZQ05_9FUNG|nr:hypothetical protein BJ085DRAFT_38589 [Dimargaris cristalligena]|eukprot:RKP34440.1 hypothetical protein BJ085DRAFT_38589 [Dimargaris cristalligena]